MLRKCLFLLCLLLTPTAYSQDMQSAIGGPFRRFPVPEPVYYPPQPPLVKPTPEQPVDQTTLQSMQLEADTRAYCRNPDGSCVQCSIVMCGFHCNEPAAYTLLWDSPYGKAVRGGSWPSRVSGYCNERGIKAWNITGWPITREWMIWAAMTGRFCAIGAGGSHFQTLYSYNAKAAKPWGVCNNNSTDRIDYYTDSQFQSLHLASGAWCVILEKSSSENPKLIKWWGEQ